jgi:hypothetical protein
MSLLYENRCLTVGLVQVGPVGDKIGSPCPPVDQGEPGVSPHTRLIRAHAAPGSVTLGPEQGELGAN